MPQTTIFDFLTRKQPRNQTDRDKHEVPPAKDISKAAGDNESVIAFEHSLQDLCVGDKTLVTSEVHDGDLSVSVPTVEPGITIDRVRPAHLPHLRRITTTLLPVRYAEGFYQECIQPGEANDLARVLLWDLRPVGWIRCRVGMQKHEKHCLYMQAIGVLAPYRGLGLASELLRQVLTPQNIERYELTSVCAHVWEGNEDALEWYQRKDFRRASVDAHYYRKLRPATAWVMVKDLT